MDKSLFEKIILELVEKRVETDVFLARYYQLKGFNKFKSAEYAENNISNFIEFANNNLSNAKLNNTPSLFIKATKDIVELNLEYYSIKKIHQNLLNIDWREFEFLCSIILEYCFGAEAVTTSQATADGGVDFQGKIPIKSLCGNSYGMINVYGQAKRYSSNVGIEAIKSFAGLANQKKREHEKKYAHPPQIFMFFTTADFSSGAKNEVLENGFIGLSGFQLANIIFKHKSILIETSNITIKEMFEVK